FREVVGSQRASGNGDPNSAEYPGPVRRRSRLSQRFITASARAESHCEHDFLHGSLGNCTADLAKTIQGYRLFRMARAVDLTLPFVAIFGNNRRIVIIQAQGGMPADEDVACREHGLAKPHSANLPIAAVDFCMRCP